jgi:hypothetical protein
MKQKAFFLEKTFKFDKPPVILTKKKESRQKLPVSRIKRYHHQ